MMPSNLPPIDDDGEIHVAASEYGAWLDHELTGLEVVVRNLRSLREWARECNLEPQPTYELMRGAAELVRSVVTELSALAPSVLVLPTAGGAEDDR
jgi:hypothetical protein